MQFSARLNFLAINSFQGRKDPSKVYTRAVFLDDASSFDVFVEDIAVLNTLHGLSRMASVDCRFTLGFGQSMRLNLDAVVPADPPQAPAAPAPQKGAPGAK